jgi:hypothetical protein
MKFTALLAICFVSGCSETSTNAQGFDRRNLTETTSPVVVQAVTPQLETPGDEDLEPIITFETLAGSSDRLIRSKATVTKPWLVSEPWCANCPLRKPDSLPLEILTIT